VPELVRMQPREAGRRTSCRDDLVQPRRRHVSSHAEPEVGQVRERMAGPHAPMAVERQGGLAAERHRPGSAALAKDDGTSGAPGRTRTGSLLFRRLLPSFRSDRSSRLWAGQVGKAFR
jgi:hypothetical protein